MYLLYGNGSAPSGRTLRQLLTCRGGMRSHYERQTAQEVLIRYGVSGGTDAPTTLNRAEAVALAANKALAFQALQSAGVAVPAFARGGELAALDNTQAILGRRNHGSGGEDITVYRPGETPGRHDLYTQFVPSRHEMRIHVFQGEMIHAQLKQYRGDGEAPQYPIRNHSRGYVFVPYTRTRPNADRVQAAVAAVGALGLDFGAVDLLVRPDGGVVVLEVNTAPGLTPRTALAYGRAFEGWCAGRGSTITLNTASLGVDDEEEACYNDSSGAASAPSEPTPEVPTTDSVDTPVGQDRAEKDEREALREQLRAMTQARDAAVRRADDLERRLSRVRSVMEEVS